MPVASRIVDEPAVGRIEAFALPTKQSDLLALRKDVFENRWDQVCFGVLIQGAVFEIRAPNASTRISLLDGYLTVNVGAWRFHVRIGETTGGRGDPTPRDIARRRRAARAEMRRILNCDDTPRAWGLRVFSGADENQLTVFFPNPFLGETDMALKRPVRDHLEMWDSFRERYLDLPPDPLDRRAGGVPCLGR